MARKRAAVKEPQATANEVMDSTTDQAVQTTNTANNGTDKERKLMALTPEQITALLANTRQKGQYTTALAEFLNSGEAGISVGETWPELAGKKDSTVSQGFENAKKNKDAPEGADKVKVIKNEGAVYLVNLAAADVEVAA